LLANKKGFTEFFFEQKKKSYQIIAITRGSSSSKFASYLFTTETKVKVKMNQTNHFSKQIFGLIYFFDHLFVRKKKKENKK